METYYKIMTKIDGFWGFNFYGVKGSIEDAHAFMKKHWPDREYMIVKFTQEIVYEKDQEPEKEGG